MRRRLIIAALILVGLPAIVVIASVLFARSRLPVVSGTLALPGLSAEVRVTRDTWGIPHIFAQNEMDAFRALGFTVAQDRLFQMDIQRRLANGELSEVFGRAALHTDKIARTFGFRHYAQKLLSADTEASRAMQAAAAFRDGANACIATQKLPVEFGLLGYTPRPFDVVDMLAFGGYMSYSFSEAFRGDILFTDLMTDLPPEKVNELRGGIEESAPTIVRTEKIGIDRQLFAALHADPLLQILGAFAGSNSWVVSPGRSKSGHAILANDPHIGFSKPAIWYEAHIVSPELEIYGHFLSLIPFPVLGHTRDIAWALTMSEMDDMDFYREKANPQNPGEIYVNGHWSELEERTETIRVKGDKDVQLRVQTGPHGPLVQNLFARPGHDLVSVKWQYHEPENRSLEAFFDLTHAKSVDQFAAALKKAKTPDLNISYADKAGNIAWWVMGQIPIRPAQSQPDMVLDGPSGADEYLGYVPFEDNPHAVNPDSGMIITANNEPVRYASYPLHGYFQPSDRIVQLHRLLDARDKWGAEEFMKVQTNEDEVFAADQVPLLLGILGPRRDAVEENAYSILQHWDGHSDVSSRGAAIYNVWRSEILRDTLMDEMGEDRFGVFCSIPNAWRFYERLIANPASLWWDDVRTKDHVETREEIVTSAFHQAVDVLKRRFGNDVNGWTWGKLHTVEYTHVLGFQKPLNLFFNAGPYPSGGNYSQVDAMSPPRGEETFGVLWGPSTRRIVDFAEIGKSWGINPLGNSGNLFSRHEKDQTDLFLHGRYRPEWMDAADIQLNTEATLILSPDGIF